MRAAEINDSGVVINYAEVTGFDDIRFLAPLDSVIGSFWNGSKFIAPAPQPPSVPVSVTMRQARQALFAAGKLDAVNAAIASMPSPQKEEAQIQWEYSSDVFRNWPLVLLLGPALGLSNADMDNLFIQAAAL